MNNLRRRVLQTITGGETSYTYIDLGLPSGLLWAECNIGATSPYDAGLFFSYGNVDGHTSAEVTSGQYSFSTANYNSTPGKSLTGDIPSNATYDAAVANMGGSWRMPTSSEFQELYSNTYTAFVTIDGNRYCQFKKKTDTSVYILIPLAGYLDGTDHKQNNTFAQYISSSGNGSDNFYELLINNNNSTVNPQNSDGNKQRGRSIRAVMPSV